MEKALAPAHVLDLQKSGLSAETIRTSGVYSVPPSEISKILVGRNGASVNSLLAFPYPGTKFTRYKLFPPCKLSRDDKKPRKYFQPPGSPIYLYEPPGFDSNNPAIRITEGEKKALRGTQEGLNVCGLGGIWNFADKDENETPQLVEALQRINWKGKKVELVPDADFQIKPHVCHAVYRLGSMLQREDAEVGVIRLPDDMKLDDYLCNHSVEAFSGLEIITLDDRIFRNAKVKEEGLISAIQATAMTIGDFLDKEIPARPYIIKPILKPGTLCQIYSERGVGKTMLASAIAISATHGVPIGKWEVEKPSGVLFIDGEMPSEDFQKRMAQLTSGLPFPLAPLTILSAEWMEREGWPRPNLTNEDWRKAIYNYLQTGIHKLVIFDNLAALTPGIDENSKQEWDDIGQWFLSLRFLGVAVCFIHHAGKSGLSRGTSGREDSLDISLKLVHPKGYKEEDGCNFNVSFDKARSVFGPDAASFNFRIVPAGNGLTWTVSDPEGGMKRLVMAALGQGWTAKEITDTLDVSHQFVYRIKKKGIEAGHLEEDGKVCKFTEQGQIEFGGITIDDLE